MKLQKVLPLFVAMMAVSCADQKSVDELSKKIGQTEERILTSVDPEASGNGALIANETINSYDEYDHDSFAYATREVISGYRVNRVDVEMFRGTTIISMTVTPVYKEGESQRSVPYSLTDEVPTQILMTESFDSVAEIRSMLMNSSKVLNCRDLVPVKVTMNSDASVELDDVETNNEEGFDVIRCTGIHTYLDVESVRKIEEIRELERQREEARGWN